MNVFALFQIPFSLTLRVWDLYLLEGEGVMVAMAYNILRMHRRFLSKLQMDEIIEHLQVSFFTYIGDPKTRHVRFLNGRPYSGFRIVHFLMVQKQACSQTISLDRFIYKNFLFLCI